MHRIHIEAVHSYRHFFQEILMDQIYKANLRKLVVSHENIKQYPYLDSVNKITIGIGYNLSDRGLPESWINEQYEQDVTYFYNSLINDYPWFGELNDARQMVLIDMCFMGYTKFKS